MVLRKGCDVASKVGSAEIRTAKWEFTALSVGILHSGVSCVVDDSSEGSILTYVSYAAFAAFCLTAMFADQSSSGCSTPSEPPVVSAIALAGGILLLDIAFAGLVHSYGPRWLVVVAPGAAAYATALRISR